MFVRHTIPRTSAKNPLFSTNAILLFAPKFESYQRPSSLLCFLSNTHILLYHCSVLLIHSPKSPLIPSFWFGVSEKDPNSPGYSQQILHLQICLSGCSEFQKELSGQCFVWLLQAMPVREGKKQAGVEKALDSSSATAALFFAKHSIYTSIQFIHF